MQLGFVVRSTLVDVLSHSAPRRKLVLTACWQATSAGERIDGSVVKDTTVSYKITTVRFQLLP